ncbi:hypothetical protein Micbo1qcDRAFT_210312 [Microdochium bolleyi]|uniref:AA1-like domain-containing protein n=1 Tax=Microdochium bolleyi TaxID=196109 RepID=A0A136IJL5_9PEZI|nr:hypothetical protein Micbo1qcDRAFT_210312 [Microdochium bolleyi]
MARPNLSSTVAMMTSLAGLAAATSEFHVPKFSAFSPSGRPGSSGYCQMEFTIVDVATLTQTECQPVFTCHQVDGETFLPFPDAAAPVTCEDNTFRVHLQDYAHVGNFRLHIEHTNSASATSAGLSNVISYDNYSRADGYVFICGAGGVCESRFDNESIPIVVPFSVQA